MRSVIITVLAFMPLLADDAKAPVQQPLPQKFTKTESLAWNDLQTRQNALNQEVREFALEGCKSHGIPIEVCKVDPQALTFAKSDPPKVESPAAEPAKGSPPKTEALKQAK